MAPIGRRAWLIGSGSAATPVAVRLDRIVIG